MSNLVSAVAIFATAFLAMDALAMDKARLETRVEEVTTRFGLSGKGAVVAIIDRGIDWKNNDFRNADGTTRIAWIYDLTDDSGSNAPANLYKAGTIYSREQVNNALAYGTNLPTRDGLGHGTTTTGIAAGGGRNLAKYRGIAPEATLIVVKFVGHAIPAHDGEPAETAYYNASRFPTALRFIDEKAKELSMPWVALANIGSVGGPMDGSSAMCRVIDNTVGPGISGKVFVTGSSDDGNMPNHASGELTQGATNILNVHKGHTSPLVCEVWYGSDDRVAVRVQTPAGTSLQFPSPANNNTFDSRSGTQYTYLHCGANVTGYGAASRRQIFVRFTGPVGEYALHLRGMTITDGTFHASLNPSRAFDPNASSNYFTSFVVPGHTVWDWASASNNICPNDYVNRTNWTDINGVARVHSKQGEMGDLWLGSGVGPTWDGRIGVDVSAPGEIVTTTYAPLSWWATARHNLVQDGGGNYGIANAVSAASPIVTGIIALMLEANPNLDARQIKRILQQSARADAFTEAVPNPVWGYGKVDALKAVELALDTRLRLLPAVAGGEFTLSAPDAFAGGIYALQTSTDLRNWKPVSTNTGTAQGVTYSLGQTATEPKFFRLQRLP